jgi:hypothetical protein
MQQRQRRQVPEERERSTVKRARVGPAPHPDQHRQSHNDVKRCGPHEQVAVREHHGVATESIR